MSEQPPPDTPPGQGAAAAPPPPAPPAGPPPGPPPPPPAPSVAPPAGSALFPRTAKNRFQFYLQERKNLSDGARGSFGRFNQLIIGLSAGAIVLSVTFLKDIGYTSDSLPWLYGAWAAFLVASLFAIIALITSAESELHLVSLLDSQADGEPSETVKSHETAAARLAGTTRELNYFSLALSIIGVIAFIAFGTINIQQRGETKWQDKNESPEKLAPPAPGQQQKQLAGPQEQKQPCAEVPAVQKQDESGPPQKPPAGGSPPKSEQPLPSKPSNEQPKEQLKPPPRQS